MLEFEEITYLEENQMPDMDNHLLESALCTCLLIPEAEESHTDQHS